jgi:hypothetical protein
MENGIGIFFAPLQELYGFFGWEDDQFNFAPLCLASNLIHDRQCSGARADHQPAASPRYLLFQRERCVTETVPEILSPDFLFEVEAVAFMMAATPVFMRL